LTLEFDIPPDFLAKGRQLEAQGRPEEAAKAYQQAIEQAPRNMQAWWSLGDLHVRQGNRPEAIRCLEEVLRLRPDNRALRDWLERYKKRP
jgi:tetratricopeptide (TPR) repeat protein